MSRNRPGTSSAPQEDDEERPQGEFSMDWRNRLAQPIRRIISQKRHRFKYEGVDLDLAYITDRIIALGYPSENIEKYLRNTMGHTLQFLRRRHGLNRVKVFNLRGGFFYDPQKFNGNVIAFDMTDHHPPRLELMAPFCREAIEWLNEDPRNVIAVHCKAGKGRTGVMICALLVYMKFYENPRQILDYYSIVRTQNNKGVTIPSQRRYIYYYNFLRKKELNYFPLRMQLVGVYVERPQATTKNGAKIQIKVANESTVVFNPPVLNILGSSWRDEINAWRDASSANPDEKLVSRRAYCFMVPEESPVFVEGDVRVDLLAYGNRDPKVGHVWFNTMFTCPGSWDTPGQKGKGKKTEDFVYGDKEFPYPEGETSIGKKDLPEEDTLENFDGINANGLRILSPPEMDTHSPPDSIKKIYLDWGIVPPRRLISKTLYDAHRRGIVLDDYNIREKKAKETGQPVEVASESLEGGINGPVSVRKEADQHVLSFPVYEMDRALKNKKLHDGLKIYVVLKCVDSKNTIVSAQSRAFCDTTFANENRREREPTIRGSYRTWTCQKPPNAVGAENREPPAIRYASSDGNFNGTANRLLNANAFPKDSRPQSQRWCRYFYKQSEKSPSKYPGKLHQCPLTGAKFSMHDDSDEDDEDKRGKKSEPSSSRHPGSSSDVSETTEAHSGQPTSSRTPTTPGGSSRRTDAPLAEEEDMTLDDEVEPLRVALREAQLRMEEFYGNASAPLLSQDYQKNLESIYSTSEKFQPLKHFNYDVTDLELEERKKVMKNMIERGTLISNNSECVESEQNDVDCMDHMSSVMEAMKLECDEEVSKQAERDTLQETGNRLKTDDSNLERYQLERGSEVFLSVADEEELKKIRNLELKKLRILHRGSGMYKAAFDMQLNWPSKWQDVLPSFYNTEEIDSWSSAEKKKKCKELQNLVGKVAPKPSREDYEQMTELYEKRWKGRLPENEEDTPDSMYRKQRSNTNSGIPLFA